MDTPSTPLHLTNVSIYDPSTAPNGKVTHKQLLKHISERIHTSSVFTQKLHKVPGNVDFPYWVDDNNMDIEFHVRHIGLPAPGDWRQLCILISRLHSRGLDMNRPLWEMYIIEGLNNIEGIPSGCFAILSKYHHAIIDGASGTEIVSGLHDLTPKPSRLDITAKKAEPLPSTRNLLVKAAINNVRWPLQFAKAIGLSQPKLRSWLKREKSPEVVEPPKTPIPKTRFNKQVSPHRVFTGAEFNFEDFRTIRKAAAGATVNDVVLTVCAGALRRYLDSHKELPEESLKAIVPINTRTDSDRDVAGNIISTMFVAIKTDIKNPLQRLKAIQQITAEEKTLDKAVSARQMTDIHQHIPAATQAMAGRLLAATGLAHRAKPFTNCIITNVPGPQVPLYMCGAKLLQTWGGVPVIDGLGLGFSAHSYNHKMFLCVVSCREMMPDPQFFEECLQASFDELLKASSTGPKKKKSKPNATPKS
jgi:WS/DGAT/MGAT family acyltransferase